MNEMQAKLDQAEVRLHELSRLMEGLRPGVMALWDHAEGETMRKQWQRMVAEFAEIVIAADSDLYGHLESKARMGALTLN